MRIQSVRQVQVMALDCWLCLLDLCMPQLIDRKRETWKLLLDINTIATSLATVATQWPSINYVKLDGFFCTCGPCNPSNIWTFAKSLTSDSTPSATQFFKRSNKISNPPGLWASWEALPSFASSSQSAKIGLSKWIFYVKNHPNLSDFFFLEE